MEGSLSGRPTKCKSIANTLQLRDAAMATIFWLSMYYNFSFLIASDTLFDSRGWVFGVKLSHEDISEITVGNDAVVLIIHKC